MDAVVVEDDNDVVAVVVGDEKDDDVDGEIVVVVAVVAIVVVADVLPHDLLVVVDINWCGTTFIKILLAGFMTCSKSECIKCEVSVDVT